MSRFVRSHSFADDGPGLVLPDSLKLAWPYGENLADGLDVRMSPDEMARLTTAASRLVMPRPGRSGASTLLRRVGCRWMDWLDDDPLAAARWVAEKTG